uniref:Uncharacterized protein n=1 Tax=Coccidioides posadasii RMSCC 3488 TaxID=454284 RepID=A0A0J6FQ69_COCPO|nr:hypothetical protein CPAG_08837 [Coccidioides posadasii RMSCC 3488]
MFTHDCPPSAGLVQTGVCAEIRSFRASVVSTGPLSNEIIPPIRLIACRVPGSKVHQPCFNAGMHRFSGGLLDTHLSYHSPGLSSLFKRVANIPLRYRLWWPEWFGSGKGLQVQFIDISSDPNLNDPRKMEIFLPRDVLGIGCKDSH